MLGMINYDQFKFSIAERIMNDMGTFHAIAKHSLYLFRKEGSIISSATTLLDEL